MPEARAWSWASNPSFSYRKTYIFVSWKPLEPAWALLADPERLLGLVRGFLGLARGLLGLFWASPGRRHKAPGHLQALFWGAKKPSRISFRCHVASLKRS